MILFLYFLIYFSLVFALRSFLLWKKTGVNPLTFQKTDNAHDFNGKLFTIISVIEFVLIAIYAFKPSWYKYLLPFWYIENTYLEKLGWVLLTVSLIVVWTSQSQMKNSWRIGVDDKNKTELVVSGIFKISRNPIFLGVLLANVGLFFVIPNAFTLLVLSLSTVSINTQIRLEESHLKETFGDDYENYTKKVNRWI